MRWESQVVPYYHLNISSVNHYLLSVMLITSTIWFLQFLWRRRKIYHFASTLQGPSSLPIIGNKLLFFYKDTEFLEQTDNMFNKYPHDIVKLWIGPTLAVIVQNPEYIEILLNHPKVLDKPYFLNSFEEVFGEGLITGSGPKWRRHRKIISISFNTKQLISYVKTFYEEAQHLTELIKNYKGDKPILEVFFAHGMNVTTKTLMGLDLNKSNVDPLFYEAASRFFELTYYRCHWIWYHSDIIWALSPSGRRIKKYSRIINNVTSNVVKSKLEVRQLKGEYLVDQDVESKLRKDFLDTILDTNAFTEQEIKDEVNTFLLAATDTSGETTTRVFLLLGMFPYWQQKVYEEIVDVIGKDGEITFDTLKKLVLTERVIKETLRILPVVNLIVREVKDDIEIGAHTIPTGTVIFLYIRGIHRNPKYWKDPLKFDPDRFLPEEEAKRHNYNYMPFSLGTRMCIGYNFALLNIKTMVATFIREFKVYTDYKSLNEIVIQDHISSKIVGGPKLRMELR